jgi:sugar phosphate isomerase/epimerase
MTEENKTFTQEEVDKIIGERLARDRSKYADHDELKEIAAELAEFGFTGTPAEVKAAIKAQKEALKKQAELEQLKEEAKTNGTTPEMLSEIKTLKAKLEELERERQAKKAEDEAATKAKEAEAKMVKDFTEKYPDVDIDKLKQDKKFMKYLSQTARNIPLIDVYESYQELVGGTETEVTEKIKANISRTTSSGKSKGEADGGTYGLTADEQELARENKMTCKEFAERKKQR